MRQGNPPEGTHPLSGPDLSPHRTCLEASPQQLMATKDQKKRREAELQSREPREFYGEVEQTSKTAKIDKSTPWKFAFGRTKIGHWFEITEDVWGGTSAERNCPKKSLIPARKRTVRRKEKQKFKKVPKRPRKILSPVQLPKVFSRALFHSFAPAF